MAAIEQIFYYDHRLYINILEVSMPLYIDFKTIEELIGYSHFRQQKEFTIEELAQFDGSNSKPAYVAIEGIVYDSSKEAEWVNRKHFGYTAGEDLTSEFKTFHDMPKLNTLTKVGVLK